jgi:undecaprenyl-diphosphatase
MSVRMERFTAEHRYLFIVFGVALLVAVTFLIPEQAVAASTDQSAFLREVERSVIARNISGERSPEILNTIGLRTTLAMALALMAGLTLAPAVRRTFQPRVSPRVPEIRVVLGVVVVLLAAVSFVYLALGASQQAYSDVDLQVARWVRSLDLPGLDGLLRTVNVFTDAHVAILLWIVAGAFFVLRGRPLEAIAVFMISGLWVGDQLLSTLVNRPSPPPELVSVVEFSRGASFPSGHVTGAVSFYGLLTFLALKNVRRGRIRVVVPVVSLLVVGLASLGRIYVSAHWPSDILGSYLFGFLGIVAIAWLYNGVQEDRLSRPHLRRRRPISEIAKGKTIAHSIASTVYLDPQAGTATKEYHPPWPVRALYRLAFQAPFPYQGNREALEAAVAKRVIVGLLTKYWFGQDIVAQAYEIRAGGNGYQFVTEFVPGMTPVSNKEIEDTLSELYAAFQKAGLPTWQIAPENPHACSNFIRTRQGGLKLIDLESALVSPSYPWQELGAALRDGNFPVFDDVDFCRLRGYVEAHAFELLESLGRTDLTELKQAIDHAERFSLIWKENEPRIWGRVARRVYRLFNPNRLFRGVRGRLDGAELMAKSFVCGAIERWESEGQIDSAQAASLRHLMSTSEVESLLKHLGAHLTLTVAIAIPIPGLRSAARFAWTLTFRLKALWTLGRGRITREEYRVARSIHSVPVMLLALIPALGALAYAASDTMVKRGLGRMLLDQSAHKIPFGLYDRLGLSRVIAPRSPEAVVPDLNGSPPSDAVSESRAGRGKRPLPACE